MSLLTENTGSLGTAIIKFSSSGVTASTGNLHIICAGWKAATKESAIIGYRTTHPGSNNGKGDIAPGFVVENGQFGGRRFDDERQVDLLQPIYKRSCHRRVVTHIGIAAPCNRHAGRARNIANCWRVNFDDNGDI